jgi:hypothetical protein
MGDYKKSMNRDAKKGFIYFIDVCDKKGISQCVHDLFDDIAIESQFTANSDETFLLSKKHRIDNLLEVIDRDNFEKDYQLLLTASNYIKYMIRE